MRTLALVAATIIITLAIDLAVAYLYLYTVDPPEGWP